MYSYIKGELIEVLDEGIVVEANQIGYNIRIPMSMIETFGGIGQEVKIYTYLYIREDAMHLYGFQTKDDLKVFKLLLGVSGIGPKGALSVLSVMTPDTLRFAVAGDDAKAISKAPGVGAKTAQRLILELRDKLTLEDAVNHTIMDVDDNLDTGKSNIRQEAVLALTALGYTSSEAVKAVGAVEITRDAAVEDILRAALKNMAV